MFTGIIQDIGSIKLVNEGLYEVNTNLNLNDIKKGSSISCNGVCLTAIEIKKNNDETFSFKVNIGEETLTRTNLGKVISNNLKINLEKSLKIGDEISGHLVYGHVDTITNVKDVIELNNSWEYYFEKNFNKNNKFISEKASISINGISLTIANIDTDFFKVSVIEHTYKNTNLKYLKVNDQVNIEFDYLARFILNDR
tara:strand:+ start:1031 stop:1621 length:591 start_codon:yes stop_codon:yes gene_type:complete